MKNELLLIRYSGDNDFSHVVWSFANVVVTSGRLRPHSGCVDIESSKLFREALAKYFNVIGNTLHEMHTGRAIDFLKIRPEEIFWGNDEVKKKLETYSQWGNGDSVLIYPDGKIEII